MQIVPLLLDNQKITSGLWLCLSRTVMDYFFFEKLTFIFQWHQAQQ